MIYMPNFTSKFLLLSISLLISIFIITPLNLIEIDNGTLIMSDFANYVTHIGEFWFNGKINLYDLATQEEINSSIAGFEVIGALPLGITPIATFVFLPFSLIAQYDLKISQICWVTISLYLFLSTIFHPLILIFKKNSFRERAIILTVLTIGLNSAVMYVSITLGQTSLIAAALILQLLILTRSPRNNLYTICSFVCLSIKPTYAIFGAAILIAQGRFKTVLLGLCTCIILTLIFTFFAGTSWPTEYLENIMTFSNHVNYKSYQNPFLSGTSNVIRNILVDYWSAEYALKISQILFYLGLAIVMIGATIVVLFQKNYKIDSQKYLYLSITFIYFYLLFATYVGFYEDLILFALMFYTLKVTIDSEVKPFSKGLLLLSLFTSFLVFNFAFLQNCPSIIFWFSKLILILSFQIILFSRLKSLKIPTIQSNV